MYFSQSASVYFCTKKSRYRHILHTFGFIAANNKTPDYKDSSAVIQVNAIRPGTTVTNGRFTI